MIRKAAPADYPRLCEIWESAVKATHEFISQEDFEYYRSRIPEYLEEVDLYTHECGNGILDGFLGISGNKVEMLFIDAAARGKGLGRKLIDYATTVLHADSLDVNEQNTQAVGFYLHCGFRIIGRSEKDGEGKNYPLLYMRK